MAMATVSGIDGMEEHGSPEFASHGPILQCLWTGHHGCPFTASDPDVLFAHLSADHIGRKATNNLNLTCHWQGCGVQCLKRDHIISHLRVHLPLKPHLCPICQKAFKRTQDLRKHEKIHTEAYHAEHRYSKSALIVRDGSIRHYSDSHSPSPAALTQQASVGSRDSTASPYSSHPSDSIDSPHATSPPQILGNTLDQVLVGSKRSHENAMAMPMMGMPPYTQLDSQMFPEHDILNLQDIKRHKVDPTYDATMGLRLDVMAQLLALDDANFAKAIGIELESTEPPPMLEPLPSIPQERAHFDADLTIPSARDFEELSAFLSTLEKDMLAQAESQNGMAPIPQTQAPAPYVEPLLTTGLTNSYRMAPEVAPQYRYPYSAGQAQQPYPALPYDYHYHSRNGPYAPLEGLSTVNRREVPRIHQRAALMTRGRTEGPVESEPAIKDQALSTTSLYPNLDTLASVALDAEEQDSQVKKRPTPIKTTLASSPDDHSPPLLSPVQGLATSLDGLDLQRKASNVENGATKPPMIDHHKRRERHASTIKGMLARLEGIKVRLRAVHGQRIRV